MLPKEEFIATDARIPAPPWPARRILPPPPISLHEACEASRDRAALHARYELLAGDTDDQAPPADTEPDDDHYQALIDTYQDGARWGLLIGGLVGAAFATLAIIIVGAMASAIPAHF